MPPPPGLAGQAVGEPPPTNAPLYTQPDIPADGIPRNVQLSPISFSRQQ
jgi:hypothetical protein